MPHSAFRAYLDHVSRPRMILASGLLTVVLTLLFGVVMAVWDFAVIDEMVAPDAVRAHVAAMSDLQRSVHAWMTGTLDVAYPFAYSAFFAGVFHRFLPKPWGRVMVAISLAVVPADLLEGLSQILILTGSEAFFGVKAVATTVKLLLYVPALIAALGTLVWVGVRRIACR